MIFRHFYFKLLLLTLLSAAALSGVSLLLLNRLANQVHFPVRQQFFEEVAQRIDSQRGQQQDLIWEIIVEEASRNMRPPRFAEGRPGGPGFFPPPPRPPPPREGEPRGPRGPGSRSQFWIYDFQRKLISANSDLPLPRECGVEIYSGDNYVVVSNEDFFRLNGGHYTVGLRSQAVLCAFDPGMPFNYQMWGTQIALIFLVVTGSFIISVLFSLWYLKSKSAEARRIIGQLERGDLKARFAINKMDQFGGLMNDFNRMAGEIEDLVHRVRKTEQTRKNLLQELAHDIRTPLTSLSSSFEALQMSSGKISEKDEKQLFEIGSAEIEYLKHLFENMMVISTLEEPGYVGDFQEIDIASLLDQEIQARKGMDGRVQLQGEIPSSPVLVKGDSLQIHRLVRNLIDNGLRHAKTGVQISLRVQDGKAWLLVQDDGSGFSSEDLKSFGHRRSRRQVQLDQGMRISLGLGSVIANAIVGNHGGKMEARNRVGPEGDSGGAEISVWLPLQ